MAPSDPYGENRQRDIYAMGMLADQPPELPLRYEELERVALSEMDDDAANYLAGGAGGERTMGSNTSAFTDWKLLPRMLRDVSERDLSVEILGDTWDVPFCLAPIGIQTIVHEDGEVATARAAADLDVPMCLSSVASVTMEEVSEELDETTKWFQLYASSDPEITESFVERAEDAGFDAIVLTADVPILGWRERDLQGGYLPMLDGEGMANYFADPVFRERLDVPPEENPDVATQAFLDVFGDPSMDWADLEDLVESTDLPVVVKGILHPEDAEEAIRRGAEGVAVSNHGGRQVDNSVGALEALPSVVETTMDRVPVTFDSGIRRGADVLTAMALGADAVMVGRPYACGLAVDGRDGVREVVTNLRADVDITLSNLGRTSVAALDRSALVPDEE
ncbi:alpha-hydroxy-acid oxidizing protein [Halomarina oriensis]|uniref:Alpha-hydroxy-acid oxidizing protein n=1 Tax=Halomarina oriensis TaxID=671145 RepID=A0A6B0GGE4_9EURY|nr:alpha-hydroxy-acid oxidizing protein [Halomarina oriensis]MWG33580.1 alpha-hydroxy-acid oxidizing protein [Halomarina oriensis]